MTQRQMASELGRARNNAVSRIERAVMPTIAFDVLDVLVVLAEQVGRSGQWLLRGESDLSAATREQLAEAMADLYRQELLGRSAPTASTAKPEAAPAPSASAMINLPASAPIATPETAQVSSGRPARRRLRLPAPSSEPAGQAADEPPFRVVETIEPGFQIVEAENLPLLWRGHYIPILGRLAAGDAPGADTVEAESHPPGWADSFLKYDGAPPSAIAARVLGDSMSPDYGDSDMIVVDLGKPVRKGICCCIYEQGSSRLCRLKHLRIERRTAWLESTNPKYPSLKLPTTAVRGYQIIDHLPRFRHSSIR